MMHSGFFALRPGFLKWRSRVGHRRARLRLLVPIVSATHLPTTVTKYHAPVLVADCPASPGIRVGEFVVGEKGDHRLVGHPAIRY